MELRASGTRQNSTRSPGSIAPVAKITTSNLYWVLASPSKGCYAPIMADAVSSIGRIIIRRSALPCESMGIRILASDTDCLMLSGWQGQEELAVGIIQGHAVNLCVRSFEVFIGSEETVHGVQPHASPHLRVRLLRIL